MNLTFSLDGAFAYVNRKGDEATVAAFLAGYADWRLPTFTELESIFDPDAVVNFFGGFGPRPGTFSARLVRNAF